MKLNRYEKKILKKLIENRKGIYETPRREKWTYSPCKEYNAALSLMLNKIIYARSTNELELEGPATPEPKYRWFTCSVYKPWKTKQQLKKLLC